MTLQRMYLEKHPCLKSVESIDDYIDYHDDPHVKALGSDFASI